MGRRFEVPFLQAFFFAGAGAAGLRFFFTGATLWKLMMLSFFVVFAFASFAFDMENITGRGSQKKRIPLRPR